MQSLVCLDLGIFPAVIQAPYIGELGPEGPREHSQRRGPVGENHAEDEEYTQDAQGLDWECL